MNLHFLRPRELAGYPIDYYKADPVTGAIDVVIWRNERRDDGFMIHCENWGHAHRLLTEIGKATEGRT